MASGRRLGKSYCIPNPTIQHVQLAAEALNLPMAIEVRIRACARVRVTSAFILHPHDHDRWISVTPRSHLLVDVFVCKSLRTTFMLPPLGP